ncbi:MarC family protein [Kozakia baliensis]|uniref:MarC family protein n=1 Tax=Kozakia baliensis TaxID=153496 RepID=UPI000494DDA1|nr:MarC family protein [Kozakia baliensis]AOX19354.1 hypothetical protein A0U90_02550 [Kozakia baliensis]
MVTPHALTEHVSLKDVTNVWLLAFPALFSIVNPLGASLIFAQATMGRSRQEVISLARVVAFNSFAILMISSWFGGWILNFFGITIDALRVSGGLVVASRAWVMLQEPEENEARKERQALQGGKTITSADLRDKAFFPLAMPFTVGPGSISVAIALSSGRSLGGSAPSHFFGLALAVIAISLVIAVVYSYAERVVVALGQTGARIVSRLSALILLCIGIQIFFAGIEGFIVSVATRLSTIDHF